MPLCTRCGKVVSEGQRYCDGCGAPQVRTNVIYVPVVVDRHKPRWGEKKVEKTVAFQDNRTFVSGLVCTGMSILCIALLLVMPWMQFTIEQRDSSITIQTDYSGKITKIEKQGNESVEYALTDNGTFVEIPVGDKTMEPVKVGDYVWHGNERDWLERSSLTGIAGVILMLFTGLAFLCIGWVRSKNKWVEAVFNLAVLCLALLLAYSSTLMLISGANFIGDDIMESHCHDSFIDLGIDIYDPSSELKYINAWFINGYIVFATGILAMAFSLSSLSEALYRKWGWLK